MEEQRRGCLLSVLLKNALSLSTGKALFVWQCQHFVAIQPRLYLLHTRSALCSLRRFAAELLSPRRVPI